MSDRTVPRNTRGAVPVRGERRKRPAWLLWLLAALALVAIAILLISLLSGDDDSDKKKSAAKPAATAQAGSLAAGEQKLLPLPSDGLQSVVGQDTVGQGVVVQSIVEGQGFWVGTSQTDRLYVEYGGAAGKTESGFKPSRVGEKVDLDGPVKPAPADPRQTLKLSAADAEQVKAEGAYINANKVSSAANQ